jgi:hypothetical protein
VKNPVWQAITAPGTFRQSGLKAVMRSFFFFREPPFAGAGFYKAQERFVKNEAAEGVAGGDFFGRRA